MPESALAPDVLPELAPQADKIHANNSVMTININFVFFTGFHLHHIFLSTASVNDYHYQQE
jgi:hypothetical protein